MKQVIVIGFYCLLILGCRKKDPAPASEATDPNGTISGKVTLIDQYGAAQTSGLNTVTVSIDGKSDVTLTDASGNYTLTDVEPGTYTVSFKRTGAGLWQKQKINLVAGAIYQLDGYSVEKPSYNFTGRIFDSISTNSLSPMDKVYIQLSMTATTTPRGVLIIRGNSPTLDIADPNSYTNVYQNSIPTNTSTAFIFFEFPITGTYYYKAYPFPDIYNGPFYDDVTLDKRRYTAYGAQMPGTFSVTH